MIELNDKIINGMFMKCLTKDELNTNIIELDTIWNKYRFNLKLVESFEKEIIFLLKQLPDVFFHPSGASVEDAIINKEGKRWGERTSAIQLFLLGIIINKVNFLKEKEELPRFSIKN
ncbi:MAG: hypothetical protein PHU32_05380 [Candidatus ainarchaeum sp.]|jgi:hypothetical protein|nr:hypothetical protein [Candidatus ainarchaeum sp.]